jgi:uncharacterized membrane protein YhaH (DUF805 family)
VATSPTRGRSSIAWLFLSFRGRISRQVYWLTFGYIFSVNAVVIGQLIGEQEGLFFNLAEAIWPFVALGTIYAQLSVSVKRLHDIGYSGFLALASVIPFVNILFTIWIGLPPGTNGPNPYGDVTDAPPS